MERAAVTTGSRSAGRSVSPAQRCRIAAVVQRLLAIFALGVETAAAARGAELVLEPLLLVAGGLASGGYGVAQR